ncbi:acyl-CoA thioesterase [Acidaminobacter hydrogenoformans]|uniref:Acyl-CoA thioester hydrolase n=1 Tax=Acidaminobacter hydrogenoformans DSM 2784 TaxID=1120920 RepID=A0A1G5S0H8_9FIRM|nr:thioesterase family protein [Acidaminobacter hydrogenoformans]SCZ79905.1 acyl-CoA thioester hydrolase [Acidaminobacter hydrogenoformans DSM 2784]
MNHFDVEMRPRYEETDQMGVVWHGNYYRYFEVARCEYLRALGYSYRGLEEAGIILPVVESSCRYRVAILYDQEIIIRTVIETFKGVKISFLYQLLDKATGLLLAEGRTLHAFVDKEMRPLRVNRLDEAFVKKVKDAMEGKS